MAGTGRIYVTSVKEVGDIKSTHQYDVSVRFDIAFDYGGHNNAGTAEYNVACEGVNQGGKTSFDVANGGGSWVWTNIGDTKTFRITMPTSGASKTVKFEAAINTRITPSYISASVSHTLLAVTWQWSVSYNANGGTGAPASQTKTYGNNLALSTTRPTRTGYTFLGWSISSTATSATYAPGATYTANAAATLYAIWKINTYTISYNANGGTGAPSAQTKTYGTNLTLSNTVPTRTNYNFKGWATSSTATSATYSAGGTFTTNATTTLYAVWELAYWVPKITNPLITRCDPNGNSSAYGTCAKVTFDWECCQITGANEVSSIEIKYAVHSDTAFTSTTVASSGTKGNASTIIGSSSLSTENMYDVVITVTDSKGGTTSVTVYLSAAAFTMDFLAGGKGVAIGKPAEVEGALDVDMNTVIRKPLTTYGDAVIGGDETVKGISVVNGDSTVQGKMYGAGGFDITGRSVLNGHFTIKSDLQQDGGAIYYNIPIQDTWNLNNMNFSTVWFANTNCTNKPVTTNGWVSCMKHSDNFLVQTYFTYDGTIYRRYKINGTWQRWQAGLTNHHKLWTGTLSKGGSVTVNNLDLYDTFMARTSDGVTTLIGTRYYDDSGNRGRDIRFVGGYDDGTNSYVFKANTYMEGTKLTLVCASKHKLANAGITGTALSLNSLWGLM